MIRISGKKSHFSSGLFHISCVTYTDIVNINKKKICKELTYILCVTDGWVICFQNIYKCIYIYFHDSLDKLCGMDNLKKKESG